MRFFDIMAELNEMGHGRSFRENFQNLIVWKEGRKCYIQHILFTVIWCQTYGKGPLR